MTVPPPASISRSKTGGGADFPVATYYPQEISGATFSPYKLSQRGSPPLIQNCAKTLCNRALGAYFEREADSPKLLETLGSEVKEWSDWNVGSCFHGYIPSALTSLGNNSAAGCGPFNNARASELERRKKAHRYGIRSRDWQTLLCLKVPLIECGWRSHRKDKR